MIAKLLHNKKRLFIALGFLQPILISLIAFRVMLFSHGILMHGDTGFPLDMWNWVTGVIYTWNPWNDRLSEHIPKAAIMVVTVLPSLMLGLSSEITQKLLLILIMSFAGIMTFFSTFILLNKKVLSIYNLRNFLICSIPSLFLQFNPWVALQIEHHAWFVLSTSALIFLLAIFMKMISDYNKNNNDIFSILKYALPIAVLIGVTATQPQFIFYTIIFLIVIVIYNLKSVIKLKKKLGLIIIISVLINLYWVLPYSLSVSAGNTKSPVDTSHSTIQLLSRNSQILNVINTDTSFASDLSIYSFNNHLLNLLWTITGVLILFSVFTGFLTKYDREKNERYYLFFISILLMAIFVAQGSQTPLRDLYFLLADLPFGWIFRNPNTFIGLIILCIVFLLGLVTRNILYHNRIKPFLKTLFVASIIFSILFHSWPTLTGNFNNHFAVASIPADYKDVVDYLKTDSKAMVLWFPYAESPFSWNPTQEKAMGKLSTYNLVFAGNLDSGSKTFLDYIFYHLIKIGQTKTAANLLEAVNIKYVVVHYDYLKNNETKQIQFTMKTSRDFQTVRETNYMTVFKVPKSSDLFSTRSQNVLASNNGVGALKVISQHYNLSDISVISRVDYHKQIPIDSTIISQNSTLANIYPQNSTNAPTKENSAEVTGYKAIDPTKYIVNVNASHPYMLVFPEAYDPLWTAKVKENEHGETVEYKSIPLYSIINGFWINKTGQYEVDVTYKPQEWFYIGAAISIATILGSLGYLIYRRREGILCLFRRL